MRAGRCLSCMCSVQCVAYRVCGQCVAYRVCVVCSVLPIYACRALTMSIWYEGAANAKCVNRGGRWSVQAPVAGAGGCWAGLSCSEKGTEVGNRNCAMLLVCSITVPRALLIRHQGGADRQHVRNQMCSGAGRESILAYFHRPVSSLFSPSVPLILDDSQPSETTRRKCLLSSPQP
jgi:hypothetical protein